MIMAGKQHRQNLEDLEYYLHQQKNTTSQGQLSHIREDIQVDEGIPGHAAVIGHISCGQGETDGLPATNRRRKLAGDAGHLGQ